MASGLKKFLWSIPGVDTALCYTSAALAQRRRARGDSETYGGGKTQNARYCYSVWMRHLVSACSGGVPHAVAEIGPGRSVGCGIAALLCGAEKYYGFEIVLYSDLASQVGILEEIASLLRERAPIPDEKEFPNVSPKLEDYSFPSALLTDELLEKSLAPERVDAIRRDLLEPDNGRRAMIRYIAPWFERGAGDNLCDFLFSQAVLEHVDELDNAYAAMARMLRPGGRMSHQIDLRSHSPSPYWNRQWGYSDRAWARIRSVRPYYINRQPLSTHLALLEKHGFAPDLTRVKEPVGVKTLPRARLAPRFQSVSDADMRACGVYIVAHKVQGT